jgi:hypothetical protein
MRHVNPTRTDDRLTRGRRAARTRTQRRRRFLVEALEDRRLLTTLFDTYIAETANDGGGYKLGTRSPGMPIYTIYWGSWWTNTSAGQSLQTQVQNSLNSIFYYSGYLNGLHQYGITYPAFVPPSGTVEVNNNSDPTDGFSRDWLQNTIGYAIDNQGLPDTDTYSNEGLYVVFTPPGIHNWNSGNYGDHGADTVWDNFPDQDTRHWAWVGDFGGLDSITTGLSHEVIEAMTDPDGDAIQVLPRDANNWNEVCDNTAQVFTAFVDGYQVQSFWSQSDGEYAVYDGNSQTVIDDHGNLIVNGDQLGPNHNDTISVDLNSEGGVLVNLNGEVFSYPDVSYEVNQVTINPGGGTDTINILNTTSSVPVTINEGSGNDSVIISPNDRSLDHIQGNITVNGGSGHDTLTIDDQNENSSFLESYTLTASTFTRANSALISYNAMNVVTVNGSGTSAETFTIQGTEPLGTTNLNVDSASSTNVVYLQGSGFWGTLNITSNGPDAVKVGDNGSVQGIFGTVNIDNPPDYTALTIDDSADSTAHSNVVLDTFTPAGDSPWGSVTGLAPGSINYEYDDTGSVTITTGTAADTINVHATGVTTNLSSAADFALNTVHVGNGGSIQGIFGTVNIEDPPSYTTLTIDDSSDTSGHSNVVLDTFTPSGDSPWGSVTGLAPAAINYEYADTNSVSITTGKAADTIDVHATGVTTTLSSGGSADAVNVGSSGSVQGLAGTLNIENPPNFTTLSIDDSLDPTGRSVALNTFTPAGDTPWASITGLSPAAISYRQMDVLSPVSIDGGSGGNAFTVLALPTQTVDLNTGGGNDTVRLQKTSGSLVVNGQGGTNTLVGPNVAETWNITGFDAGSVGNVTFSNVQNVSGGTANDTFVMGTSGWLLGSINGGGGTDSLVGPNIGTNWYVTGANSGAIASTHFTGIADLTGGSGGDTFQFSSHAAVSGTVDGGGGTNTLDYALYSTGVSVNLALGTATGAASIAHFQDVDGSAFNDHLTGGPVACVLAGDGGTDALVGGTGNATFVVAATQGAGTTVAGGAGVNTLNGASIANTWTLTGANAGNLNGIAFTGVANLVGGSNTDTFKFASAGSVTGKVDGGGGTNTLDYSGDGGVAATVNLASDTATKSGSFANIQALVGSTSSADKLIGTNSTTLTNVWSITNNNAGTVGSFGFSAIKYLTGGSGEDVFVFGAGKTISGKIDGAGGTNWLDYSAYTTAVTVILDPTDPKAYSATGIDGGLAGGIANIRNVRGGQGGNTLVATHTSQGNILIGGAGPNTIKGGTGRSILIGGKGKDTVIGGSGNDILIAGYTDYDSSSVAHDQALELILAEWHSADSYSLRISRIKSGGGLNGLNTLTWGGTVHDNSTSSANTLTGADEPGAQNWFFANLSHTTTNRSGNEQLN